MRGEESFELLTGCIYRKYFASLVNSTGEVKSLLHYQPALYIKTISQLW